MNFKYRNLLKDTFIFAVGSLGSKVILFFLVPLYTNYLTTSEYGIAELVSTFSQLLIPITSIVISQAVIRYGMMKSEKPEDVLKVSFVILFFSAIATVLVSLLLQFYEPISEWCFYLCVQVILNNITEVEKTYLKVKDKNKIFAVISILQTAILACANLLLLTVYHQGVRGYLMANITGAALGTILAFVYGDVYHDLKKGRFDKDLTKRMVGYSAPLVLSNVSWWIVHSSDKIMIEAMVTASVLGIYTVATKIPSLINVMIGFFNQAWSLASIKEIESTKEMRFYTFVFKLFSTFLFGACIFFVTIIKPFMSVYVGDGFKYAWAYTPLLLSAAVFYCVAAFIGTLYSVLQKSKHDMWTAILSAIINVAVNYIGIRVVGAWGAVIGTVFAFWLYSTVRIVDIQRLMPFYVGKTYWVNMVLLIVHAIAVTFQWYPVAMSILIIALYSFVNRSEILLLWEKVFATFLKRGNKTI